MMKYRFRKRLSAPGLLKLARSCFDNVQDTLSIRAISLSDCLMSGLAVFGLKYASLLQFDRGRDDEVVQSNLKNLYGIAQVPCDTYLRERLDNVEPKVLRQTFKQMFVQLQRGKALESYKALSGDYLVSVDGTGYFSSNKVHCKGCCEKHHRNGRVTYYHQLLGAALVHPDHREVFPLMPEAIQQQDGTSKNDCERNAAKRLLTSIRQDHPHLKLMILEDALASNGPHIQLLRDLKMNFILGAKASDHGFLFDWVNNTAATRTVEFTDDQDVTHRYRYLNRAPLNKTHCELEINFLEYWAIPPIGKALHFSWVTDVEITPENVEPLMRAGRARWRIENETFNTLKNQGYHFEHNFGHGYQHLSTVLACLMMLAFLVDQIQQRCCRLVQATQAVMQRKLYFWQKLRRLFFEYLLPDWQTLYGAMLYGIKPTTPQLNNTS
jgi:hypothetical protein